MLTARRKDLRLRFPNLVDYESKVLFRSFYTPRPLPAPDTLVDDVEVRKTLFGGVKRTPVRRPFQRSSDRAQRAAAAPADRHPARAQHLLHGADLAHLLRGAGRPSEHVVFSDYTSEELWAEGGKYGSIDPCYPVEGLPGAHPQPALSQAAPAARFHLLPVHHARAVVRRQHDGQRVVPDRRGRAEGGARGVHEGDRLLRRARHRLRRRRVTLAEPNYFARQMFEMWGERLGITEDENDWACRRGLRGAARARRRPASAAASRSCSSSRKSRRSACCCSDGRIISIRASITACSTNSRRSAIRCCPSDRSRRIRSGWRGSSRTISSAASSHRRSTSSDVWPENYSANSVQKVWAAKFAARHPEHRRARSLELQVRPRRADLRADRQHHLVERHALLGAARHRREQARRVDQDPREAPTRTRCRCTRSGSRISRRSDPSCSAGSRKSGASCCGTRERAAGGPARCETPARGRREHGRRVSHVSVGGSGAAGVRRRAAPMPPFSEGNRMMSRHAIHGRPTTTRSKPSSRRSKRPSARRLGLDDEPIDALGRSPTRRRSRAPSAAHTTILFGGLTMAHDSARARGARRPRLRHAAARRARHRGAALRQGVRQPRRSAIRPTSRSATS